MNYKWNKKELLIKRSIYQLLGQKKYKDLIDTMLSIYDIKNNSVNKQDILICDETHELNYNEMFQYYFNGLIYIPDDYYDKFTDIFSWFQDLSCLDTTLSLDKTDLKNEDIITLTHDIIMMLDNKILLDEFNRIIKNKSSIHIQDLEPDKVNSSTQHLGGITFYDQGFNKSYISIFRNYTMEDVEISTHEFMHAILNNLLCKSRKNSKEIYLLRELEGIYGSYATFIFLEKIGFKNEAKDLKKYQLNSIISASFLMMVNHVLFNTSKNNAFNLEKANETLKDYLEYVKIQVLEEELPHYLTINGFEEATTILSYLTVLDLINNSTSLKEATKKLLILKQNDSIDIENNLSSNGVTFHQTGYKNLIKEYNNLR